MSEGMHGPQRLKAVPSMARNSNLATVLRVVLTADEPPSRAEIATQLGLTRSTVSRLVDELLAAGFVTELEPVTGRRGRPAVPITPAAEGMIAIGLEVNVERLVVTAVNVAGEVVEQSADLVDVGAMSPDEAIARLAGLTRDLVAKLPESSHIVGAHLALPALVDRSGRVVLRAPNLGWDGTRPGEQLDALLADVLPRPVSVGNDIDASALTVIREAHVGGESSFLYISGEVGIGSAISMGGNLMVGVHGWASELGHFCVEPGGARCGCGSDGCLETVVGLHWLLEAAGQPDLKALREAIQAGDETARAAITRAAGALAIAIGGALSLLDLERVVFGGHLADLSAWLFPPLTVDLQRRVLWAPYSGIVLSTVEEASYRAAVGSALAAMGRVTRDPARWIDSVSA